MGKLMKKYGFWKKNIFFVKKVESNCLFLEFFEIKINRFSMKKMDFG